MLKNVKHLEYLFQIAELFPTPIYWIDTEGVILGANALTLKKAGGQSFIDYVGKSLYDIYPVEMADKIKQHNDKIIESGQTLTNEETIQDLTTGNIRCYQVIKSPLYDDNGKIIGILSTSIEITAQKEVEELRHINYQLEVKNKINETIVEQQSKFKKVVEKVIHDIQSPLTTMKIILSRISATQEQKSALNQVASRIKDITSKLDNNEITGILSSFIEIDNQKEAEKIRIFNDIERIANILPAPIYWLDTKGMVLGANDIALKMVGGWDSQNKIIGKEHDNFYPKEVADTLIENNNKVIQEGQTVEFEEKIVDITTGEIKYLTSIRSPLKNNDGDIIGIIGTSIDITDKKEKERLKDENIAHEITTEQQSKFKKVVEKVMHDIQSPLTTMKMILPHISAAQEQKAALNQAAARIRDITSNLLNSFKYGEIDCKFPLENNARFPVLISTEILEIVTAKRYEYGTNGRIRLIAEISPHAHTAFLNIDTNNFKRMLSNIINNAQDALGDRESGVITVCLDLVESSKVRIIIKDNGNGMPLEVKEKILNNMRISADKEDGHGIGYEQIRETLKNNEGVLDIDSKIGEGTRIILTFPQISTPDWVCDQIELNQADTVIIVDDDESIHVAWDTKLNKCNPEIKRLHFIQAKEALEYISQCSETQKENMVLISDYEFINQDINGQEVIFQAGIKHSILSTSYYNQEETQKRIQILNARILPKTILAFVPIYLSSGIAPSWAIGTDKVTNKNTELVLVDDDNILLLTYKNFLFKDRNVDTYTNPEDLLANIEKYSLDTPIALDNNYAGISITGIEVAQSLYKKGFRRLFILSGTDPKKLDCKGIATALFKIDIDNIKQQLIL